MEPTSTNEAALKDIRVLVLDDEAPVRKVIKTVLERQGCVVETAEDGRQGLQILLQRGFDVLLVDLLMDEMDGLAFLQEARKIWPWLGVIIISGNIDTDSMAQAEALGVTQFLEKPISAESLRESVLAEASEKASRVEASEPRPLDQMQSHFSVLRELGEEAISGESLVDALKSLSGGLGRLAPSSLVGALGTEGEEQVMILSVQEPVSRDFIAQTEDEMISRFQALSGSTLDRKTLRVQIENEDLVSDQPSHMASLFSVPIITGGQVHGLLTLTSKEAGTYESTDMSYLYHAANQFSTVLVALSRMRQLAIRDALTGLYNRRHLEEELEHAWTFAARYDTPISVAILDVDSFKSFNDTHGHDIGDQILREFSALLMKVARSSDVVGRFGGDEFVVVFPREGVEAGKLFGERFAEAVRSHTFCEGTKDLTMTTSIGVAERKDGSKATSHQDLLKYADQALYAAKEAGKNKVMTWPVAVDTETAPRQERPMPDDLKPRPLLAEDETAKQILLVDDDRTLRRSLRRMLEYEGYRVEDYATVPEAAQEINTRPGEFAVAITDLQIGEESGLDFLNAIRDSSEALIKIVITGHATVDNAIASLRYGAYDFIQKPIVREQLLAVLDRGLEYRRLVTENERYQGDLEEMVREKSKALTNALKQVEHSYEFTLEALVNMLDMREHATGQHSHRVRDLALILAKEMKITGEELDDIARGALLHDIGKIAIPDGVLLKPGKLTPEEWELMKKHAEIGYNIVEPSPYLRKAAQIVLSHQEKYDGTGYPRGLKAEEIPLGSRIFAVVDAYDAMRSERPYSASQSEKKVVGIILKDVGTHFDPDVVKAFLRCQSKFEETARYPSPDEEEAGVKDRALT